jgi:hypothetical protein
MRVDPERDVVLLNSDTLVSGDWVQRLAAAAYGDDDIATVTPLSNNATICSFPLAGAANDIPTEMAASIDAAAAIVNAGRAVEIPTGVGFCIYLRRDALDALGLFDESRWGAGYGEEVDLCRRALKSGHRNVFALDVFVYHAGEVSFAADASDRKVRAQRQLVDLHTDFEDAVRRHVLLDPAQPARFALSAALHRDGRPTILFITHALGGGVEQHVGELTARLRNEAHVVRLSPVRGSTAVIVSSDDAARGFRLYVDGASQNETLIALLRDLNVSRAHVHHIMGYPFNVRDLIDTLDVPFDFTVHDYFAVCPQVTMTDRNGVYCGEPDASGCDACILDRPHEPFLDIASWRDRYAWLFFDAERVITPSLDTARRIQRYYPEVNVVTAAHP